MNLGTYRCDYLEKHTAPSISSTPERRKYHKSGVYCVDAAVQTHADTYFDMWELPRVLLISAPEENKTLSEYNKYRKKLLKWGQIGTNNHDTV